MTKITIDKNLILEYTSTSNNPNDYNYIPTVDTSPAFNQQEIEQMHMLSPFEKQSLSNSNMDQIQNDPIKKRALDKLKQYYQINGKKALEFTVTQHSQF